MSRLTDKMDSVLENVVDINLTTERLICAQDSFVGMPRELVSYIRPELSSTLIINIKLQGELMMNLGASLKVHNEKMIDVIREIDDMV